MRGYKNQDKNKFKSMKDPLNMAIIEHQVDRIYKHNLILK